jgi:ATP-dependent Clp protease ATP-binding subunit ClpC
MGRDLTKLAEDGELDPLIGREMQLELMIQALARRRKNNPVLVGDPGVGKTAVVEGLAQKIVGGRVPEALCDKRIVELNIATLLAGTKNRGEFEERMKSVVDELLASKKQIILFIDEIHAIAGAGRSGGDGSSVDAAGILKPVLARGDVQVIGATTVEEYRSHIEKDSSLERRFQPITVNETSFVETVQILQGLAKRYENHHKVQYSEEALVACVRLATEHIPDRFMPDKAIDIFDEVGAYVQLRRPVGPEKAPMSDLLNKARQQLEDVQIEKEAAVKAEKYSVAARLKLREMSLQATLRDIASKVEDPHGANAEGKQSADRVTENNVAQVVSRMTGVPLEKLSDDETARMLNLEVVLHSRVIGQGHAVMAVSQALRRARVGLKNSNRPIASFLFCGPTGVGKTELCKALAEAYFGKEDAMIRLDMSEFMERHAVSKIIGSPAGYIGYGDENQFTDRIRRKPYSLVLLDEVEKAHTDVLNLLLQVMEDGRLSDSTGRRVSFKNALIIMTSNVGSTTQELNQSFSPEFLNRLDDVIPFSSLTKNQVASIAALEFAKTAARVKERGAILTLSEAFKDEVVKQGFCDVYGARALRRTVVKLLDDELASSLLKHSFVEGEHVHVDVNADRRVVVLRADIEETDVAQSESDAAQDSESSGHEAPSLEGEARPIDSESTADSLPSVEHARLIGVALPLKTSRVKSRTFDTDGAEDSELLEKPSSNLGAKINESVFAPQRPLSELAIAS